jgi:hypothetical protein
MNLATHYHRPILRVCGALFRRLLYTYMFILLIVGIHPTIRRISAMKESSDTQSLGLGRSWKHEVNLRWIECLEMYPSSGLWY